MGKNNKRNKTRKDQAVLLDVNCDADRFDSLAESENEDADFRTVTVSLIELRNMIRNEVNSHFIELNKSVVCLIDELRSDLALRLDCIDNRLNESLTNSKSVKQDFATLIDDLNLNFVKLKETVAKSSHTTHSTADVSNDAPKSNAHDVLLQEMKERESKKDSTILFNVPESNSGNPDDRKVADRAVYDTVCNSLKIEKHDVISLYRIGRQQTGKLRPLIVKTDTHTKKSLLINAKKLRHSVDDDTLKSIIIRPDLTKKEQESEKRLVAELKRRKENNEKVFIRNGAIVVVNNPE